jgi:hypothetical protein
LRSFVHPSKHAHRSENDYCERDFIPVVVPQSLSRSRCPAVVLAGRFPQRALVAHGLFRASTLSRGRLTGRHGSISGRLGFLRSRVSPTPTDSRPVRGKAAPTRPDRRPVRASRPPVRGTHRPAPANRRPIRGDCGPARGNRSPVRASHSPARGNHCPVRGSRSPAPENRHFWPFFANLGLGSPEAAPPVPQHPITPTLRHSK